MPPSPQAPASDPPLRDASVRAFLDALGAKSPTPGGGAAAGVTGALAAALAEMVVQFSVGKKSLAPHEHTLKAALDKLQRTRAVMLELADEDAHAYARLNALMKLPESDPDRQRAWSQAVTLCVQIPRAMLAASLDALRLMEELATCTNRQLKSDLAIAAVLAEATARASIHNTAINLGLLEDDGRAEGGGQRRAIETDLARSHTEAIERARKIEAACAPT